MKHLFARRWVMCATVMFLGGCFDDTNDIERYIDSVKSTTEAKIEPIPEVKPFIHISYEKADKRSPFLEPKPEEINEVIDPLLDCLHPDPNRLKQPLEKYALANLKMKGTMGDQAGLWALIESSTDGSVYRVSVGDHMGLFNGRITRVQGEQLALLEMVPDGSGCWEKRTTIIDINGAEKIRGGQS